MADKKQATEPAVSISPAVALIGWLVATLGAVIAKDLWKSLWSWICKSIGEWVNYRKRKYGGIPHSDTCTFAHHKYRLFELRLALNDVAEEDLNRVASGINPMTAVDILSSDMRRLESIKVLTSSRRLFKKRTTSGMTAYLNYQSRVRLYLDDLKKGEMSMLNPELVASRIEVDRCIRNKF